MLAEPSASKAAYHPQLSLALITEYPLLMHLGLSPDIFDNLPSCA